MVRVRWTGNRRGTGRYNIDMIDGHLADAEEVINFDTMTGIVETRIGFDGIGQHRRDSNQRTLHRGRASLPRQEGRDAEAERRAFCRDRGDAPSTACRASGASSTCGGARIYQPGKFRDPVVRLEHARNDRTRAGTRLISGSGSQHRSVHTSPSRWTSSAPTSVRRSGRGLISGAARALPVLIRRTEQAPPASEQRYDRHNRHGTYKAGWRRRADDRRRAHPQHQALRRHHRDRPARCRR